MKTVQSRWWGAVALIALLFLQACSKDPMAEYRASAGSVADITAPKPDYSSLDPGFTNWCYEWSRETYLESYESQGRRDPKWDEIVRPALSNYARLRVTDEALTIEHRRDFQRAVDAGCDDPLVVYLYTRIMYDPEQATRKTAVKFTLAARQLDDSPYAGLIQCFGHLRAAQAWRSTDTNKPPQVNEHRGLAFDRLLKVLQHDALPVTFAFQFCDELYRELSRSPQSAELFRQKIEPLFVARWPEEARTLLLKGRFAVDDAWEARGSGWANTVTDEGWKVFRQRLGDAEQALNQSWKLDPTLPGTPLEFMRVELGQGRGRARMELWFNRAIVHPTSRYDALFQKLWYLQPRWHGSEEECLQVARDILKSDDFKGNCPLHLYHLHESLARYFGDRRPEYWLEPHVWPDIKAAFERYFSLHETDNGWRHSYILCAYRCRQWATVNEELGKLDYVNYAYFGGEEEFNRMKAEAQRHTQE